MSISRLKNFLYDFVFITLVSLTLHFFYSRFGFNPTDEGMYLSYAKRLINFQIPHKDFVSIMPSGSALFHIFDVLIFKDYLLLYSRFQSIVFYVAMCTIWSKIIFRTFRITINKIIEYSFILLSILLCLHDFPLMSWSSIDGLIIATIGSYFVLLKGGNRKTLGYFIMSLSYLMKQSFVFYPFAVLFISGDYKKVRFVLISFLPIIIYFLTITILGGFNDMFNQLTAAQTNRRLLRITFNYFTNITIIIGAFISFSFSLIAQKSNPINLKPFYKRTISYIYLFVLILYFGISILKVDFHIISFLIFGLCSGLMLEKFYKNSIFKYGSDSMFFITLSLSYCVSLSGGYPWPTLFSGVNLFCLIAYYQKYFNIIDRKYFLPAYIILFIFVIVSFNHGRLNNIMNDLAAKELNYDLTNVFPGANGIYTSENTSIICKELKTIVDDLGNQKYAILPEMAVYWAASEDINPLPIDWVHWWIVPNDALFERMENALVNFSQSGVIILQKFRGNRMSSGFKPWRTQIDYETYPIIPFVRNNFTKIKETKFFELYTQ